MLSVHPFLPFNNCDDSIKKILTLFFAVIKTKYSPVYSTYLSEAYIKLKEWNTKVPLFPSGCCLMELYTNREYDVYLEMDFDDYITLDCHLSSGIYYIVSLVPFSWSINLPSISYKKGTLKLEWLGCLLLRGDLFLLQLLWIEERDALTLWLELVELGFKTCF